MPLAFSNEWAAAWGAALNDSPEYRAAAAAWEGSVAASVTDPGAPAPRAAVYLDLWHGECRAARTASPGDLADATYLLEAAPAAWRELLGSGASPLMALMTGRLQLTRGELATLLPYAGAARELVRLATAVSTEFPPDW